MEHTYKKVSAIILITGLVLVLAGISLNQWTVAFFFSSDGELSIPNKRAIEVINILCITIGILFILLHKKNKEITSLLFGTLISLMVIVIAEGIFFIRNRQGDSGIRTTMDGSLIMNDSVLGYKFHPNVQITSEKWNQNHLVFRATYSIDSLGRRITPLNDPEHRDSFLLFLGCSFTFGHGLNDNQTLSFYTAKQMPHYFPYNYGVEGYGTQSVLLNMQENISRNEIPQQHGIGLYIFTDDHIYRAIGSMEVYNMWGQFMPYYTLEGNRLVQKGNFTIGRTILSTCYWLLGKSQLLRYAKVNLPLAITRRHLMLVLRLVQGIYNTFNEKFPGSPFYVIIYPGTSYADELITLFKQNEVPYFDYSKLFDPSDKRYRFDGDAHPSEEANRVLSEKLAADLSED